ncbi:hypothetical protein BGZ60DRAFT_529942 [Tricladium varicosporioides]|nr:hypothetical protein BGZ60DRAFT_529942 [Hymenoscyphus varicosporioides]
MESYKWTVSITEVEKDWDRGRHFSDTEDDWGDDYGYDPGEDDYDIDNDTLSTGCGWNTLQRAAANSYNEPSRHWCCIGHCPSNDLVVQNVRTAIKELVYIWILEKTELLTGGHMRQSPRRLEDPNVTGPPVWSLAAAIVGQYFPLAFATSYSFTLYS